jgi:hypothetical protein
MTPLQFEDKAGFGASNNWKRSLKHQGKVLAYWINRGLIKPCQKYCSCRLCRDASPSKMSATSPLPRRRGSSLSGGTPRNANLLKIKELSQGSPDDSDSGVSVTSYTKALKVDVSPGQGDELASTSSSSLASTFSAPNQDVGLPDYTTMVQEALFSLKDVTGDIGCSQMNILLYVLHKYSPREEIGSVNAKVKSALRFLSRLQMVKRVTLEGMEESDSDPEQEESPRDQEEESEAVSKGSGAQSEVKKSEVRVQSKTTKALEKVNTNRKEETKRETGQ